MNIIVLNYYAYNILLIHHISFSNFHHVFISKLHYDCKRLGSVLFIIPNHSNQLQSNRSRQALSNCVRKIFHLRASVKNTYAESFFDISSICLFYLQTGCLENISQYPAGEHLRHPSLLQSIFFMKFMFDYFFISFLTIQTLKFLDNILEQIDNESGSSSSAATSPDDDECDESTKKGWFSLLLLLLEEALV